MRNQDRRALYCAPEPRSTSAHDTLRTPTMGSTTGLHAALRAHARMHHSDACRAARPDPDAPRAKPIDLPQPRTVKGMKRPAMVRVLQTTPPAMHECRRVSGLFCQARAA